VTTKVISVPGYLITFALLVLLTLLTVGVSFLPLPGIWHYCLGLAIGACKAALVVLIFMHALRASRVTWTVIAVTGFWVGILVVLTMADYLSRGLVPYAPGH
jgi:cytochrome c oxidase subunit IV